jgi:tripartite-type tricarboxylate transporter receptor subunit TctC
MAPGVPADRAAAIQAAFMKAVADPELVAEAQRAQLDINPLSGPQLQQIVDDFYRMPENVKARLKTALTFTT